MRQTEKHSKLHISWIMLLTLIILSSCGSDNDSSTPPVATTAKFAVISDPHLYDGATLGKSSPELTESSVQENKLLAESEEIVSSAITKLSLSSIDFVLVSGDLTKDGEKTSHELMAAKLSELKSKGKKIFVIPGNHDVNNPLALSYLTSPPSPVTNISPEDFERIYADFGYREAISRDPDSLSYIAEPVPGMWLFALDSCKYDNNALQGSPTTSGAFSSATRSWIIARLQDAKTQGKVIVGMMHHGILEHLQGQSSAYPEYVLDDWQEVAADFAGNGLEMVFTGHFHANDVIQREFKGAKLHDIETGSLVTYPNAYRIGEYNMVTKELALRSERVTSIPAHLLDFEVYAQNTSRKNLSEISMNLLSMHPYNLQEPTLSSVAQLLVAGLMAHYNGNEAPGLITMSTFQALINSSDQATHDLGQVLESLWTDLPPADNTVTIISSQR